MLYGEVRFFVAAHTAWAPGIDTDAAWLAWAHDHLDSIVMSEPKLQAMPPMLRRRASATGKMALEAAYQCLPAQAGDSNTTEIPIIFASRHGECARSVALLQELVMNAPLSPATFSLSVHNANAGLLSIARGDRGNHLAIAAGDSTVEHALIEACGLLADGAQQVLLVVADSPLPEIFRAYGDEPEQAFAWAWLLQKEQAAQGSDGFSLRWWPADSLNSNDDHDIAPSDLPSDLPAGLSPLRFFLRGDARLSRIANKQQWQWSRHA